MKNTKKIICIILAIVMLVVLNGCMGFKQVIDTSIAFDYAIIKLPNGEVIEGKCSSWLDFQDGDQLQVKINGVTYLTHATNVVLIDR